MAFHPSHDLTIVPHRLVFCQTQHSKLIDEYAMSPEAAKVSMRLSVPVLEDWHEPGDESSEYATLDDDDDEDDDILSMGVAHRSA